MQRGLLDGSHLVQPGLLFLVGELDDQNAVLGHQSDQHDDADLAEDVHRLVRAPHEDQRAGDGQRHGEHDHQRVLEALELRGEDQVDQHDGQDEGEHQARRALAELLRVAGQRRAEVVAERLVGDAVHFVESLPDGLALGQSGRHGGRQEAVVVVELRRRDVLRERNEVVHLDHLALVAAHVDRTQVGGLVALLAVDLGQDFVLLAVHVEVAETLAAQSREIRAAHRAAVEREIERAPVKLLIPTGTLILPALLLSILGPLLGAGGMM